MQRETRWTVLDRKEIYPRFWLHTEQENLLLSWAMVSQIRASADFLSIRFLCEYGQVRLSSGDSLRGLFEHMQIERVWRIDGPALACRITGERSFSPDM